MLRLMGANTLRGSQTLADTDLVSDFMRNFDQRRQVEMSLQDFLIACRKDPLMYASAAERLLSAIGEPQLIDTAQDQRFGRIFMNRTIRSYPSFSSFYG